MGIAEVLMEYKVLLGKYRIALDAEGEPVILHASTAGATYKAQEIETGREVAVELIPAAALGPAARKRLETEAESAQQLNHINIPAFCDFGWEDENAVYVTEYLDGTTTEAWVKGHGPMPTAAVLRIGLQVLGALGAAAFHRMVHHAINPANLMIVPGQTTEGGWPLIKVLHLVGLARHVSSNGADPAARYASPEQLQAGLIDLRSEIYSLGCTLQFLLTGIPPIADVHAVTQSRQMRLALGRLRGLPKNVRRLLARMVAISPDARPQDPIALYETIQDCLSRVERRETLARKFGIIPIRQSLTAIPIDRRIPIGLAVAAAILFLAVMVGFALPQRFGPGRLFGSKRDPVGVPIGVPDDAANRQKAGINHPASIAAATSATSPAASTQQVNSTAPADNSPNSSEQAAAGGELFSASSAADAAIENANLAIASTPAPREPETVARSTESSQKVADNRAVAPQKSEPEAPAEGPRANRPSGDAPPASDDSGSVATNASATSQPAEQPRVASTNDEPKAVAQAPATGMTEQDITATAKPEPTTSATSKPKSVATAAKTRGKKRIRVERALPVEDEMPVARGTVHARVIGTTPDGRLVLATPSGPAVVSGSSESDIPTERPRVRVRRAIPVNDLPPFIPPPPPLPAFPPEE
jgi:serine/threonine-protein kinase